MSIRESTGPRPLLALTSAARAICQLPTVPTQDWCDRAAECLAPLFGSSDVLILFSAGEGAGAPIDAIGVASRRGDPARLTETEDPRLSALRSRASRLESIHTPSGGTSVMRDGAWRSGSFGALWSGDSWSDLLVSETTVGTDGTSLSLVVVIATSGSGPEAADWLEAIVPVLGAHARGALGGTRANPRAWLTPREQEVMEQLIMGKSVKDIAETLGRSPHTVHDHVKQLHKKLNANTRGELIARALGRLSADGELDMSAAPAGGSRPSVTP